MLRFEFELRPLAEVARWGGDKPSLHWFGLTDGWYWISVRGREILRYREEAVSRWNLERPYPGYQVVRLWEDVIVLSWALLEPVPDDLIGFVDGTFPRREFPDEWSDAVDSALDLQSDFNMYLGYLAKSPILRCWRRNETITLCQQISPEDRDTFDGPPRLEIQVPAAEFYAAVEDFDSRLITAMAERVAECERNPLPAVDLDLTHLRREHTDRSQWLQRRLSQPRATDWDAVRAGAAEMSAWPLE
ncbi:DUF5984 family protein [Actinoplanes sp. NPDC051861]|uniref:DUF5984 family protein n=1 Tax=Actinoplanes sp. NPDC051861 TaxID=3155170 RepID=UPI003431CA16